MKPPIIVVEGDAAKIILSRFLPSDVYERVEIVDGGEHSDALNAATSLLYAQPRPVVLVANSNTTDERLIFEYKGMSEYCLRQSQGEYPYKLAIAVPSVEVLLVQDEKMLASLSSGHTVQPFELDYARENPKQYLQRRFGSGGDYASWLTKTLPDLPVDVTHQGESEGFLREIIEFVRSVYAREEKSHHVVHV